MTNVVTEVTKALNAPPFDVVTWQVTTHPNRRHLKLTVSPGGTVNLAVPPTATPHAVAAYLARHIDRITAAVEGQRANTSTPTTNAKPLTDGTFYSLFNSDHRLHRTEIPSGRAYIDHRNRLAVDRRNPKAGITDWYREAGAEFARDRAETWAPLVLAPGAPTPAVVVRHLGKRRWGIYNRTTNTITLHWPLFQFHPDVVTGVIVHELAHAAMPAGEVHGPDWSRHMSRVQPEWQELAAELDDVGRGAWNGTFETPTVR